MQTTPPPLKKRGKPTTGPGPLIEQIIAGTVAGGFEVKGEYDRKGAARVRRSLNFHGATLGLRFSVRQTQAGGLWVERMKVDS